MRKGFLASIAGLLAGAGLAMSGEPPKEKGLPPIVNAPAKKIADTAAPAGNHPLVLENGASCSDCKPGSDVWFNAEYLLWWIKDHPLPVPLISTGPLGEPDTTVLLGGEDLDTDARQGGRFTLGGWLNKDHTIGLEGNYFFLGREAESRTVSSSGLPGSLVLGFPFLDLTATPPAEELFFLANPGIASDVSTVSVSTFLQGAELNGIVNVASPANVRVGLIGGFRYLDLDERLTFSSFSPGVVPGIDLFDILDRFDTRNQFYGGQVGIRADVTRGRFFLNGTGKIAIGEMNQEVDVNGRFINVLRGTGPTVVTPGGWFSQPSNLGRHSRDEFAWIPEVTVNAGVNLTENISAFVGYNFLWVSDVLRPGDQIDRAFNFTNRPGVRFEESSFWAQGINFGLQVRY